LCAAGDGRSLIELEAGTFWVYGCELVYCIRIRVIRIENAGRVILTDCVFTGVVSGGDPSLEVRGSCVLDDSKAGWVACAEANTREGSCIIFFLCPPASLGDTPRESAGD
jgi:hypothetical protein